MLTRHRSGGDASSLVSTGIFDAQGNKLVALTGPRDAVESACFGPDAQWIVTIGRDRTVRKFELPSGRESWCQSVNGLPFALACSHDGRFLGLLTSPDCVQLRATETGGLIHEIRRKGLSCIGLSDSADEIWAGTGGGILHCRLAPSVEIASFEIGMPVRSVAAVSRLKATACDAMGRVHAVVLGSGLSA